MPNGVTTETLIAIARCIQDGVTVRGTERLAGAHRDTIGRLVERGAVDVQGPYIGGLDPRVYTVEYLRTGWTLDEIAEKGFVKDPLAVLVQAVPGWDASKCPCGLKWGHPERCWWFHQNHRDELRQPSRSGAKCPSCPMYLLGGVGAICRNCWFAGITEALWPKKCPECGSKKYRYSELCMACRRKQQAEARALQLVLHNNPEHQLYLEERKQRQCLKQGRQLLKQAKAALRNPGVLQSLKRA